MASKEIDFVSAVDNSDEDAIVKPEEDVFDNTFEDFFACTKSLLEATKFDDANVSHDVELKINPPKVWKKPLKIYSCSSCESRFWSQLHRISKRIDAKPEAKKTKRSCWCHREYDWNWPWKKTVFHYDDDAFPSSPTIETISEDLNEMKIKIK